MYVYIRIKFRKLNFRSWKVGCSQFKATNSQLLTPNSLSEALPCPSNPKQSLNYFIG